MKFLAPAVTIIVTAHMKPTLGEALGTVIAQTRKDFQCLVLDSGQWVEREGERAAAMGSVYREYNQHPLIEWVFTGEPPDLIRKVCPVAWVTNEAIRAGLVRGRYVCTFYDDDLYDPEFAEEMAGYLDEHPEAAAVWCTEQRATWRPHTGTEVTTSIPATGPKTAGQMDCQVDGAQVMFRREMLDKIGDPWLPEDPADASCRHSDGIFLEKLAQAAGVIYPLGKALVTHRHTPMSTYSPC